MNKNIEDGYEDMLDNDLDYTDPQHNRRHDLDQRRLISLLEKNRKGPVWLIYLPYLSVLVLVVTIIGGAYVVRYQTDLNTQKMITKVDAKLYRSEIQRITERLNNQEKRMDRHNTSATTQMRTIGEKVEKIFIFLLEQQSQRGSK